MSSAFFAIAWTFTLAGGLIVLGGLGALTSDSDLDTLFGPYRLAWTAWSFEVFALLVGLYALILGPFRHWRSTVLYFYASITPILITLTNDVLINKSKLPGSNNSDTRANTTAAGLIIVLIGNGIQALLAALHDVEGPAGPAVDSNRSGKDDV